MAATWKDDRTPFRVAGLTAIVRGERVQVQRSTGTKDRALADRIANAMEDAAQGRMSAQKALEFLEGLEDLRARRMAEKGFDALLRMVTGAGLKEKRGATARTFVEGWLRRTTGEVAPATRMKYEQTARLFLESLGPVADDEMHRITEAHVVRFRDAQQERVAAVSANVLFKIVRSILAAAEAAGELPKNPARNLKVLKTSRDSARRAFTEAELQRLLAVADDEWRSMIIFGFYTSARLGDLASAKWQQIDPVARVFTYTSRKTGRTTIVTMHPALLAHVEKMPAGDDPAQPLHPRIYKAWSLRQQSNTLSRAFGELLAAAGLIAERPRQRREDGKSRAERRESAALSFHCLRHTTVSELKNRGVSDSIAGDIAGHDSAEMSRLYTHIGDTAKREALDRLPDITGLLAMGGGKGTNKKPRKG